MNPRTKSILVGLYLGDGTITKPITPKDNCYMMVQHSIKQIEYIKWLKEQLSEICNKKEIRINVRHSGEFINYKTANFETHRHPFFRQLRSYYIDGKKTVRKWMLTWLTPEAIAVWYMDDGSIVTRNYKNKNGESYKYNGGCKIATCSFTEKECQILLDYLEKTYDIKGKVYLTKGKNPTLFFNVTNTKKFIDLIKDYIPSCMSYKISLKREALS